MPAARIRCRFTVTLFALALSAWAKGAPTVADSSDLRKVPGLADRSEEAPLADLFRKTDPKNDAQWNSEILAELAGNQLKMLGAAMAEVGDADSNLPQVLDAGFRSAPLRPVVKEVFRDGSLRVLRAQGGEEKTSVTRDTFGAELDRLRSIYPSTTTVHTKFKVIRVSTKENIAETVAYVQSDGTTPAGVIQQSATWTCEWRGDSKEKPPLLTGISVADYEEVLPAAAASTSEIPKRPEGGPSPGAGPLFQDATVALIGRNPSWSRDLIYGADHWYGNLDVTFGIHQGNHGVSIVDIDGDEREDVFLAQPAGLPNRMFHQLPDGTLEDVSHASGLDWLDNTRCALFVDLDNDGDADAVLVLGYSAQIFEADGHGHFRPRSVIELFSWPASIAAADYDNDGDIDLYFCGYNPRGETAPGDIFANPVPYHDANNGARNFMIENTGGWNFRDTTNETGLDMNNRKFSFAAVWEDFDNDGDQDLYVANDFGRKNLYRNDLIRDGKRADRPRFVDIADEAGVGDLGAGMSVTWGDYNHDGLMDLYVANMFSSAGNRIASQQQFKAGEDEQNRAKFLRHARGNSLFKNLGNGKFADVSEEAGVTLGRWAWGSLFVDINNDSWEDLYVVNGFFTTPDTGDL
ncbi:MAG: FG-GAP repeat domain-containing protein [Verrucomicrobiales bacterium]